VNGVWVTQTTIVSSLVRMKVSNEFVYSIFSGACGLTSTDTINVIQTSDPEAIGDVFSTEFSTPLDSTVLDNDTPNTPDFIYELTTEPEHGFVNLNPDGSFNYVPDAGYVGSDFFEYQLCNINCLEKCSEARVVIEIGLDAECEAPDIFTPNNDGSNETFVIPCLQLYEGSSIQIFNRWGDEVFASDNYLNDWDGTYRGDDLPVGTYYYILHINDPQQTILNGYIFLQR